MRILRRSAALAALVAFVFPVTAAADSYWPMLSGPPAGVMDGVLVGYGKGNGSGAVAIRASDGREQFFYLAGTPTMIDNRVVQCPLPPSGRFVPPKALCPDWPKYIRIGHTRVRVYYWMGSHYGKRALITRGLTVLR